MKHETFDDTEENVTICDLTESKLLSNRMLKLERSSPSTSPSLEAESSESDNSVQKVPSIGDPYDDGSIGKCLNVSIVCRLMAWQVFQ